MVIFYLGIRNINKQRAVASKYYDGLFETVRQNIKKVEYRTNRTESTRKEQLRDTWRDARIILNIEKATEKILNEFEKEYNLFLEK